MSDTILRHRSGTTLALLATCWLVVSLVGWSVYYAAGDAGALVGNRALSWAVAIPVAIVVGLLLVRFVERRRPLRQPEQLAILATAGWGIANVMGWTVDVTVGGPTTGLVTGCVLVAAGQDRPTRMRILLAVLAGVAGLVAGRLLAGEGYTPLPVAVPLVLGLAGFAVAWAVLAVRLPWWPVAGLTVGWGMIWVLAYLLSQQVLSGLSVTVVIGAELVGACTLGGALTGWAWRRLTGESMTIVALRWAATSTAGVGLGAGLAIVLFALNVAPDNVTGPLDLLAAGTTFGLGLAASVALLPTLRRTVRDRERDRLR